MSNKDSNGFERPWTLFVEPYTNGTGVTKLRRKIIPNPDHLNVKEITSAWAFSMCAKDAILHNQTEAQHAFEAHVTDMHKWP